MAGRLDYLASTHKSSLDHVPAGTEFATTQYTYENPSLMARHLGANWRYELGFESVASSQELASEIALYSFEQDTPLNETLTEIIALHIDGASNEVIALQMGLSAVDVKNVLEKATQTMATQLNLLAESDEVVFEVEEPEVITPVVSVQPPEVGSRDVQHAPVEKREASRRQKELAAEYREQKNQRTGARNIGAVAVVDATKPVASNLREELEWKDDALCAQTDPESFFPEKGGSTKQAKSVCVSCDVREKCLDYALKSDERFGIWGGLSERERRKLKKRRSA